MDEQWAGYDYYLSALQPADTQPGGLWHLQGSRSAGVRPDCLLPEFRSLSVAVEPLPACRDRLRAMQMRDIRHTKIPRALRFNDRISMMHGTELREPFLDHRLVELALRQPVKRKIRGGVQKWLVRHIMRKALPGSIAEAQKRPVQTPQREWLRGVLRGWADDRIRSALARYGNLWLDSDRVLDHWQRYCRGEGDNSYYVFQWVSLGLCCELYNM